MEEKKNWLRSACAILAALLFCMIVLNFARSEALSDAAARIRAVYQKALYESCELTEGLSVNYRKLLVAADEGQMQTLLGEISRQCQGASGNLALLPLGQKTVSSTLKFINQAEDFAKTLSVKLASGDGASGADYEAMLSLSEAAAEFSRAMNALLERYERGEVVFGEERSAADDDAAYHPLSGTESEYPTLLYDGPFSDGITGGSYEMLANAREITADEAASVLKAFIPCEDVRYLGLDQPEIPCYEFSLRSGKYAISAAVSKAGGHVLYLLPENVQAAETMDSGELCAIAGDFLRAKGYGDMEMSYFSAYNGVMTINFAAVQDGIILYPDLIKLQLSMEDGSVIGMDAKGYLKNHRLRDLPPPVIGESAAMDLAGKRMEAHDARLCVIPQNRQEFFCYEISASDGEDQFLVYIDAQTGAQRELMQLISRENGTLVM